MVLQTGEVFNRFGRRDRKSSLSEFTYRLRVPILFLSPVSILLGASAAVRTGSSVSTREIILLLITAMSGHLAAYNFSDFTAYLSGDTSGGSMPFRSLIGSASSDRRTAYASVFLSIVFASVSFGLFIRFALNVSPLVFLYLAAVIFCLSLFRFLLHRVPQISLFLPGIGFGPVAVCLSAFILTGRHSLTAFIASLLVFFMVTGLMILSLFDDNSSIWWKNRAFHISRRTCRIIYSACWILSYSSVILGCALSCFPDASMITWFTAYSALPLVSESMQFSSGTSENLLPFEKHGIAICIAAPLVLSLSLIYG